MKHLVRPETNCLQLLDGIENVASIRCYAILKKKKIVAEDMLQFVKWFFSWFHPPHLLDPRSTGDQPFKLLILVRIVSDTESW